MKYCLVILAFGAPLAAQHAFDTAVKPVLRKNCLGCHGSRNPAGNFSIQPFLDPASVASERVEWEKILQKIRSGEMPPANIPRPAEADVAGLRKAVEAEFERIDRTTKPDPGRVTARRLNRVEYTNTIRDLLGIDFRATRDFPADDSGHGFDNIGDVLSVSPVLMEKYLNAAERIAARAIGSEALPAKPLDFEYHTKDKTAQRLDASAVEATHRVGWDADYTIRIGLPGERTKDAAPVTLALFMDGKVIASKQVETKPSGLVYFNPYSEEEFKLFLPEGDHVFRAAFLNDPYVKTLSRKDQFDDKKNKTLNMIKFIGPFATERENVSRKMVLVCDPATGAACVNRILTGIATRAWRRPVTQAEVAKLARFVDQAKKEGLSAERGIQLALQAVLVSPHFLFRMERDADPRDATKPHKITPYELASRLSYFLWSSMPDQALMASAASGKLATPAELKAQVHRMLADPKSAAFAENFAGQWLEVRNLDQVKPDPQKFPEWGPALRDAMKEETRLFFETMLRENRPLGDFLDAKFTFVNETLARHYGIEGVEGPEFRRVELANEQRGGILSHASVLTVSSYPTRTSPVIRGKYILENVLGTPPPPPPPDVPPLAEDKVGVGASLRKQMEAHRTNPTCASCHNRMDVLGFGLENYDAIGKWRTKDGGFDIDAGGTFPNGKKFATPAEMRLLLRDDLPDFARCLTEKMLTYGLGRGLEPYDRRTVASIYKQLEAAEFRFQTLVEAIVESPAFQMRRGEEVSEHNGKATKEVAQR